MRSGSGDALGAVPQLRQFTYMNAQLVKTEALTGRLV
jgi:hypothetical protein